MKGESETVHIELLGGFRISVGSRSVGEDGWRLKKAASLVKILALSPNHRLHREQVMEMLWPELDPKAATNNLRGALYVARRILEPNTAAAPRHLQLVDDRIELCPEGPLWVDVEAFEAAAKRARESAAYRTAIDLYAGDLLPENRYETWAEDRREGLRGTYLGLLSGLAKLYEERDEFELAIEVLQRAVASEPTREEAHTELIRLLAIAGRRHDALLQYERLRKILSEELGDEPGEAARCLYDEIRAGRSLTPRLSAEVRVRAEPPELSRHNLPAERTSFVGREEELAEVERLLCTTRLLALTGSGGSGKTRFALEVAKRLLGTYPDGAWFVELASLSDPTLAPQAVAQALDVYEQPGRSLTAALKDHLSPKKLLLVLDNCEHLLDAVARLVETLLDSCPGLRVLVTSREALNVAGELIWQVSTLSVPGRSPTVEELVGFESVRLFAERARYRQPTFALTHDNARAVADICRKLDGIPLAIELAAARVGALSVEQIANRLEKNLTLLTGSRTAPPRQRTLEGALDWSHDLLDEQEKILFGRLSVFAGGWTLEAAEVVGSGIKEGEVLERLLRLVDRSLVVADADSGGAVRYRMLEPVRQYGQERLEESGEAEQVREWHAEHCLALAEEAEPELTGERQVEWLELLETEHGNLRAALSWVLDPKEAGPEERAELGLSIVAALWRFWDSRGHLDEGRRWLERGLSGSDAPSVARAKALGGIGWVANFQGDYEQAVAWLEESLALHKELADKSGAAVSLAYLGHTVLRQGDRGRVASLREEAETLRWESLDRQAIAHLIVFLGLAALDDGDLDRTVALFEESLALFRELGDVGGIVVCLSALGLTVLEQGAHERAAALLDEDLRLSWKLGDKVGIAYSLLGLAGISGSRTQPARAARLWAAAEVLRESIGLPLSLYVSTRYDYEGRLAAARTQLDEAAWAVAWSEGRAMAPEQAVEYALSGEEEFQTTAPEASPVGKKPMETLTRREREVAMLLARDLTNRQISSELVISERTVATHVHKILDKLGLRSRTQVAARVRE